MGYFIPVESQQFANFNHWVTSASHVLTRHPEYNDTEHAKGPPWRGHQDDQGNADAPV